MNKYLLLFSFICIFHSVFSIKTLKDSVQIPELIITGTKTAISRKIIPLSVSQISYSEIENTGQRNVLKLLNTYIPGVFVTERALMGFGVAKGGSGSITMRGVNSEPNTSVLVLIDGHPQYQGIFGHPLADAYVASDVQRVEVIRGPASILYGSNAMAGVVNLITKNQNEDGWKTNMGASYGTFNTQKYNGSLGYKNKKVRAYISANHDRTDGSRMNTDFKISNGYAKLGYEINNNFNINADFSMAKFYANDNGPVNAAPLPFNIDIIRGKVALTLDNKFENADGALKIYHNFGEHTLSDGFHSSDRNSGVVLYETFRLFRSNNLTIGSDWKQYGGIVNGPPPVANKLLTIDELAIYAYIQQQVFGKVTLSAGLRYHNNAVFKSEFIPMGGMSYVLNDNTSFKASVSKGFRSPTIMELYMYAPNPVLKPERMMNYELSWFQSILQNKLQYELTAFWVKGENMIQVVVPPLPAKRQNTGTFDNKGIEFSVKYIILNNLVLHANYNYLFLEKVLLEAPRQQVNFSANYHHKIWNINLSTQYIDKLYTRLRTNTTDAFTQSYTLVNARLSYRPFKEVEFFVAGNNLFNQKYEINFAYPMPGVNFGTGFNIRL